MAGGVVRLGSVLHGYRYTWHEDHRGRRWWSAECTCGDWQGGFGSFTEAEQWITLHLAREGVV